MKRFRISFLAVLAILAIGLTAATKVDVFKNTASTYTCQEDIDFLRGDFKRISDGDIFTSLYNDRISGTTENGTGTSCPGEENYCAKNLTVLNEGGSGFTCTNGTGEFCCAELITSASPCGESTPVDYSLYTTKVKIWCKVTESSAGQ